MPLNATILKGFALQGIKYFLKYWQFLVESFKTAIWVSSGQPSAAVFVYFQPPIIYSDCHFENLKDLISHQTKSTQKWDSGVTTLKRRAENRSRVDRHHARKNFLPFLELLKIKQTHFEAFKCFLVHLLLDGCGTMLLLEPTTYYRADLNSVHERSPGESARFDSSHRASIKEKRKQCLLLHAVLTLSMRI